MVIRADEASAGASSCRMAAWPRSRAGIAAGAGRAVRRSARRGVMAVAAVSCAALLAGLGAAAPAAGSVSRGSAARPAGSGGLLWLSTYQGRGGDLTGAGSARAAGAAVRALAAPSGPLPVTAYVASRAARTVTPIRTATGKPGKAIRVGKFPFAIAITPNGKTAYVVDRFGNYV